MKEKEIKGTLVLKLSKFVIIVKKFYHILTSQKSLAGILTFLVTLHDISFKNLHKNMLIYRRASAGKL